MTAVASMFLGLILVVIWPPIQQGLNAVSHLMVDSNPTLAAFIFGVVERALIPFGLHHIFYSPFWFEFGEYVNKAGQIVKGDHNIFFAQLRDDVTLTGSTFQVGKYPFMMFGFQLRHLRCTMKQDHNIKSMLAGIMGSAALTSFLTGITEPLEFSFLFVAPVLFAVHCVFAGLSFMTMQILDVKIGMTFSGGFIDFLIFGVFRNRTPWWDVIIVGLILAVIYYSVSGLSFANSISKHQDVKMQRLKPNMAEALVQRMTCHITFSKLSVGKENIKHLDACITRLRIEVNEKYTM